MFVGCFAASEENVAQFGGFARVFGTVLEEDDKEGRLVAKAAERAGKSLLTSSSHACCIFS